MNIAVIFAGGTGQRMNTKTKPKQFLELHGKPILVYTLEVFQRSKAIDGVVLVMIEEWIDYTKELIKKYGVKKVKSIIPGGKTGQESICNGVMKAHEICNNGGVVLVHDGVRPLIDEDTIEACIECVNQNGTAITISPAIETIAYMNEEKKVGKIIQRKNCQMVKAPQCFMLDDLYNAHLKAIHEEQRDFIDSASLMQYYGHELHTVEGPPENIKITTPSDFYIFRAILDAKENSQIFGL